NPLTITYDYDNHGNTTAKTHSSFISENTAYDYDVANSLMKVRQAGVVQGQYDYNTAGMRVRQRGGDRGDVDYFYDGRSVIEERNALDSSLLARYHYADRLISLDTGTSSQFYHYDGLGSTVNLLTVSK